MSELHKALGDISNIRKQVALTTQFAGEFSICLNLVYAKSPRSRLTGAHLEAKGLVTVCG